MSEDRLHEAKACVDLAVAELHHAQAQVEVARDQLEKARRRLETAINVSGLRS